LKQTIFPFKAEITLKQTDISASKVLENISCQNIFPSFEQFFTVEQTSFVH